MTTLEHAPLGRRGNLSPIVGLAGLAVAVALGMGLVVSPAIGLGAGALALLVPLLLSPLARLLFVVAGAMVVLNVSDTLSLGKVAYLLGCGVVVAIAIHGLSSLRGSEAYAEVRSLLRVSFLFSTFVALEMVFALSSGASPSGVLRESAAYLLFASVPLLAVDARSSSRSRLIGLVFVVVALGGTLSYAVQFVSSRGIAELPVDRITLAGALPAAMLCYLSAGFLIGRRRTLWAVAAGVVLALLVVAANRSVAVLLVGPLAISCLGGKGRWKRATRLLFVGALIAALAGLAIGVIGRAFDMDTSYLSRRYESLLDPADLRSDPSVNVRIAQTRVAWNVFRSHPIFGAGPGYEFVWYDPLTGLPESSPYIDSPLHLPAKFGIVGAIFFLSFVIAYGSLLLRLNRSPTVYRAAALGFAATQFAWALIGSPLSDEGTSLGLLMLLALSLSTSEHPASRGYPPSAHVPSAGEPSQKR